MKFFLLLFLCSGEDCKDVRQAIIPVPTSYECDSMQKMISQKNVWPLEIKGVVQYWWVVDSICMENSPY